MSTEARHESAPYIVLVLGPPAAGKSTISAEIARRWALPVVSKDALKEILFDTLGTGDAGWSVKLGHASFALLDHLIELQLRTRLPFLIDAAYSAEFENAKFQRWQDEYGFVAVQVHCTASPNELARRFIHRVHDGTRHPGHADTHRAAEFGETLKDGRYGALDLRGPVLHHDTEQANSESVLLERLQAILPP